MSEKRITTLDELELSVHHTISDEPPRSQEEYEIHAGFADEIHVPKSLVELVKTVTGVDILMIFAGLLLAAPLVAALGYYGEKSGFLD